MFKPKLFTTLKEYTKEQFIKDLIAGIIVGIVALPLAIAFAIASGVSPEKGLYTAIIAGFIISFFGGSRVQIGGPTGAFIVIVYGIVQQYGVDGLTIATFMAGIILMIMGFAKFGSVIKFVPHPLIVGFTAGIALIIFSSQMKDFFGLEMGAVPSEFIDKWADYFKHFDAINWYALIVASGTVIITLGFSKITSKIPGSLVAILLFTTLAILLKWPLETIGSKFGNIPSSLPLPVMPHIDFEIIKPIPIKEYVTWTNIPSPIPIEQYIPAFLEYTRLFLLTTAKSGPGLMTASKCSNATVKNSVRYSIFLKK